MSHCIFTVWMPLHTPLFCILLYSSPHHCIHIEYFTVYCSYFTVYRLLYCMHHYSHITVCNTIHTPLYALLFTHHCCFTHLIVHTCTSLFISFSLYVTIYHCISTFNGCILTLSMHYQCRRPLDCVYSRRLKYCRWPTFHCFKIGLLMTYYCVFCCRLEAYLTPSTTSLPSSSDCVGDLQSS